jgi:hypothetical protein
MRRLRAKGLFHMIANAWLLKCGFMSAKSYIYKNAKISGRLAPVMPVALRQQAVDISRYIAELSNMSL